MFRSKPRHLLRAGLLLAVSAALCAQHAEVAPSLSSLANVCGNRITPQDAALAQQQPYLFAWTMFLYLNCPAQTGTNAPLLWETWKPVQNVYVPPGQTPAPWGSPLGPRILLDRAEIDGYSLLDVKGLPVLEEIRMNRGTFDYIVQRNLYSKKGQLAFFTSSQDPIAFPSDSVEIKAAWLILDPNDPRTATYYTVRASYVDLNGQSHEVLAGLAGFHIASKVIPHWFWTTFEHTGNQQMTKAPNRTPDSPEVRAFNNKVHSVLPQGSVWRNYNMRGVQTDYTEQPSLQPTLLSNTLLETRFQRSSSCITCHNLSTRGSEREGRLGLWTANYRGHVGQVGSATNHYKDTFGRPVCYNAGSDAFTTCRLPVQRTVYKTMDFVWSLREAQ